MLILLTVPVTIPSRFAFKVPVLIFKFPVEVPENEPVPTINLPWFSEKPINALSEEPLLIIIPESPVGGESRRPFANSIKVSLICALVDDIVVVSPVTVKFPCTVKLPPRILMPPACISKPLPVILTISLKFPSSSVSILKLILLID